MGYVETAALFTENEEKRKMIQNTQKSTLITSGRTPSWCSHLKEGKAKAEEGIVYQRWHPFDLN